MGLHPPVDAIPGPALLPNLPTQLSGVDTDLDESQEVVKFAKQLELINKGEAANLKVDGGGVVGGVEVGGIVGSVRLLRMCRNPGLLCLPAYTLCKQVPPRRKNLAQA